MNNQQNSNWREELKPKITIFQEKDLEIKKYIMPFLEEYWKSLKPAISSTIQSEVDKAVKEREDAIEKLKFIIGDINSYEPDGEVNTLCEQAYEIINNLTSPTRATMGDKEE